MIHKIPLPQMMPITSRLALRPLLLNYTSQLHAWDLQCKAGPLVGSSNANDSEELDSECKTALGTSIYFTMFSFLGIHKSDM